MTIRLTDIKSTLSGGGARPNLFRVELNNIPPSIQSEWDSREFSILCKAAGLPASNIGVVEVPFLGRTFKVAGDRTFDTWTVTIINDDTFDLRRPLEEWMQAVAQYQDGSGIKDPEGYMGEATVYQLLRNPSNVGDGVANNQGTGLQGGRRYKFVDIFPTNLSQIDLSYDSTDQIEEFTCEFQVNYWYPDDENTNEFVGGAEEPDTGAATPPEGDSEGVISSTNLTPENRQELASRILGGGTRSRISSRRRG